MKKLLMNLIIAVAATSSVANASNTELDQATLLRTSVVKKIFDCKDFLSSANPSALQSWINLSKYHALTDKEELKTNLIINSKNTCGEILTAIEVISALKM